MHESLVKPCLCTFPVRVRIEKLEGQERAKRVKLERDEAVEDAQEEGQYSALFIDKLQSKLDELKKLCAAEGISAHAVEQAITDC